VVITFDDGRCAVYSAPLLLSFFEQAEEVVEVGLPNDNDPKKVAHED
jgi:hypothetical protein